MDIVVRDINGNHLGTLELPEEKRRVEAIDMARWHYSDPVIGDEVVITLTFEEER